MDVFTPEIRKRFGTIYTPEFVVEATINLAFKHLDKSLDRTILTYCDPAAGDGNFLVALYHKLMEDEQFISKFPNPVIRSYHILTHSIYGIEILKFSWAKCRNRLLSLHLEIDKNNELPIDLSELHIYWGNTILTPEDDFEIDESIGEGGLLPEEMR